MSAPIIFYMFLNAFAPLVISDQYLTTIVFDEPVSLAHTGATNSELYLKKSPDSKMIFIKTKGKRIKTNLNVPTKSGKLYSFLLVSGEQPHSIVQIKDGKKDTDFKIVKKTSYITIEEGKHTVRVLNNSSEEQLINFRKVPSNSKVELPKGSPVFFNEKRIFR